MNASQPMACRTLGPGQPLIRELIISPFLNRDADSYDQRDAESVDRKTDENYPGIKIGDRIFSIHLYVQKSPHLKDTHRVAIEEVLRGILSKRHRILSAAQTESLNWKAYMFYFPGSRGEELDDAQKNIIQLVEQVIKDNRQTFKTMYPKKADTHSSAELNEFGRREFGERCPPTFGEELFLLESSPMGKSNL